MAGFFREQPASGPLSLVLRLPFAGAVRAAGGGLTAEYRAGAFACLLACIALGVALALLLRARGEPLWLQLVAAAGCVANPVTSSVLFWGHPEDFLAASLAVASLLFALGGRPRAAALALGLGLGAKLWVVLAVVPVLALIAPAQRVRAALVAACVAGALIAPMVIGNPGAFHRSLSAVSRYGSEPGSLTQASAWWAAGDAVQYRHVVLVDGKPALAQSNGWQLDRRLTRITHPLIAALALLIGLLWWRRHDPGGRERTALGLAALVFLLRAPLDPANHSYYHLPFLLCLLAWETVSLRRAPVATVAAAVGLHLVARGPASLGDGTFNAVYLAGAAAFAAYLCVAVFGRWGNVRAPWNSSGTT